MVTRTTFAIAWLVVRERKRELQLRSPDMYRYIVSLVHAVDGNTRAMKRISWHIVRLTPLRRCPWWVGGGGGGGGPLRPNRSWNAIASPIDIDEVDSQRAEVGCPKQ